jgi:outer membrane receptor protein involved in Fe transport
MFSKKNYFSNDGTLFYRLNVAMRRKIILAIIILTSLASHNQLLAQSNKGAIRGKITDKKNGEALPGVNVVVKGTARGAATDFEGKFAIPELNSGDYQLDISLIGYKQVQRTGVKVTAGATTEINLQLEETLLALGQEVVIIGERPLFSIDETATRRTISRAEIEKAVVEDVTDVVATQVGVVQSDDEIHIRGGRSYENAFLLDGVSVQDPLAGTGFGLNLSAEAIEEVEVLTGGFNAEFGQAMSGIVNVTTKEGGEKYHGAVSYKRDHFGNYDPSTFLIGTFSEQSPFSFNADIAEFSVHGPEPITSYLLPALGIHPPGNFSIFTNLYALLSDNFTKYSAEQLYASTFYGTRFAPRQENDYSGLVKLTWRIDPTHKLMFSYNGSAVINQNTQSLQTNLEYVPPGPGYPYEFQENLDNFNTFTHLNNQISLAWTHTLNSRTFYELKLTRYFVNLRAEPAGMPWPDYLEPFDFPRPPILTYVENSDGSITVPPDGFYDAGNGPTWHDHFVEDFTLKAELSYNHSQRHNYKAGLEMTYRDMQLIDIYAPWSGPLGLNNDIYRVYPNYGAMYVQDKITYEGMIVNLGLRFDYWFPGEYVEDAVENSNVATINEAAREKFFNETYTLFGHSWKGRLSPRLGVSFPITDNQILFFSYGHFSKLPRPQFVYAKLGPNNSRSAFQRIGNPNLNPETTVAYEIGLKHKFSENDALSISAYYRDIFDYVTTVNVSGTGRFIRESFTTYLNLDYSRSRGVEVEYKKRAGDFLTGSVTGSYSIATGKSSSPDDAYLVARGVLPERAITEDFLIWDRPWQFGLNLNFFVSPQRKLRLFGLPLPNNWNFNVRYFAQAGKRYTPQFFTDSYTNNGKPIYTDDVDRNEQPDDPYGKTAELWQWVNAGFEKYFKLRGTTLALFIEGINLFNHQNSNIINPITGRAYENGDPTPTSWNDPLYPDVQSPATPFPFNPARYLTPRNVMLGVRARF